MNSNSKSGQIINGGENIAINTKRDATPEGFERAGAGMRRKIQ